MPGRLYLTLQNGQTVSSAFVMDTPGRTFAVEVPSNGTAASVGVQFTTTSGVGVFSALQRMDGSGAAFSIHSGNGPAFGVLPGCPTPWGRLALSAAPTSVISFSLKSNSNFLHAARTAPVPRPAS